MIKVIFMAKETFSSKRSLEYLCSNSDEIKIVGAVVRNSDYELQKVCKKNDIELLTEQDLKNSYDEGKLEADYILSFYWKKVGKELLDIPLKGSINFHPGPLPEARGSGYHIAILENWGYWGVTAHYMDEAFDTGEIIECRHFSIADDIVNKDLVRITHEQLFWLFKDTIDKILCGEKFERRKQAEGRYFSIRDLENSKLIHQDDSVEQINRKIRAFWNPPYSGAQIEIKGKRYTVINEDVLTWIAERMDI